MPYIELVNLNLRRWLYDMVPGALRVGRDRGMGGGWVKVPPVSIFCLFYLFLIIFGSEMAIWV